MSWLDDVRSAMDDLTEGACLTTPTAAQRTASINEIDGMLAEVASFRAQYPRVNHSLLDTAVTDLSRARTALAGAQRLSNGRYCIGFPVERYIDGAALSITEFEVMNAGGELLPSGGGGGGETKPSPEPGPAPAPQEDDDGRPSLVVPPSSLMTWLGVGLLGGAAVLGVVYLSKKGKRR